MGIGWMELSPSRPKPGIENDLLRNTAVSQKRTLMRFAGLNSVGFGRISQAQDSDIIQAELRAIL